MSEVVRLTLVSHAMTDAMAAGRFPTDEPLNSRRPPSGRRLDRTGCHRAGLLRTREADEANRGASRPPGRHRHTAGGPGLRPLARRRPRRRALRRSRDLADRPDAGATRRRVRRRSDRPGTRLDGVIDHPPRPPGRRHTSGSDSRGHRDRPRCASEIVLAHRYCTCEPDRHALPRARLDTAVEPLGQPIGTRSNVWFTTDNSRSTAWRVGGGAGFGCRL